MMPAHPIEEFVAQLRDLILRLPLVADSRMTKKKRLTLQADVFAAIDALNDLGSKLDPIQQPEEVFDPSDPNQMGSLIAERLLARKRTPLAGLERFYGSGVYAIYYDGDFPAYRPICRSDTPIYVGKVDPAEAMALTPMQQEPRLWERLVRDHARSISRAENLDIDDFFCRYLVVKSAWQNTAETHLIDVFKPIWNMKICYGFGKHGDSAATRSNSRSPWELHPGRGWAGIGNKPNPRPAAHIIANIAEHFAQYPSRYEQRSIR